MRDLSGALPISMLTLSRALDQSPDCVKLLDLDGRLVWMNANGLCAMEIDDFAGVSGRQWTELWPDSDAGNVSASLVTASEQGMATFTGICPTAKGTERWWDVTVHPAESEQGHKVGYISISRDVTERVNQLAAMEAIVAEMRHRLRNSYTIVCGLIRGLARGNSEVTDFSTELQRRITALADAQSLFVTGNTHTSLATLISVLVGPFKGQDGVTMEFDVDPEIGIDARVSDALALTVGELVVNSAKHGAIGKGGRIRVSGRVADDALTIVWEESAVKPVTGTTRDGGQGLRIITQMLLANSATLDLTWGTHGPIAVVVLSKGFATRTANSSL